MKRALSAVLSPVFAGAFILSACMVQASAQTTSATVVAACGTPPATYPAGANRALTQDTTGTLCSTGSGGGGGGGTSSNFGAAFPAAGTAVGFKDSTGTNMAAGNLTAAGAIKTDTTSVNGVTTLTGAGATGTGAQRVTAAQDTTTVAGAAPLTTGIYVTGPSAAALATAALQPTNAAQGSTTSGQTGHLVQGAVTTAAPTYTTAQTSPLSLTTSGGLRTSDAAVLAAVSGPIPAQVTNGVNIGGVEGLAASGSSVTGNPLLDGGRAATTAPTAVTDGQAIAKQLTAEGRTVVAPYAIKELMVRGTATSTDTSAHTIIASAGGSLKNYITGLQCGRTDAGATAIVLTLSDAASTVIILPSGGATNIQFAIPLATAAATAFQFTSGTGVSTAYCSAQGYTGL